MIESIMDFWRSCVSAAATIAEASGKN